MNDNDLEYQKKLYLQLSLICLRHVEAQREGNAKKAEKMLSKILNKGAEADTSSLKDFLHSGKFNPGYGGSARQALKELNSIQYFRSHNIDYDFDLESSLSTVLKSSWLNGFDRYLDLYQETCRKLERTNNRTEEKNDKSLDYSSVEKSFSSNVEYRSHAGFSTANKEKTGSQELSGSILDTIDEMFKRWQSHSSEVKFSYDDLQFFEKYFGGLSFDYEETIKNGIRMKSLFEKFDQYVSSKSGIFSKQQSQNPISITQLLELADIISKEVPKELLRDISSHGEAALIDSEILGKIDIHHALEKYQEACETYQKYYDSLPEERKEFERSMFKSVFYRYDGLNLDYDKFEIVSPAKLTSIVNKKVTDKMVSNSSKYETASIQAISLITKATKYMKPEEIASVYGSIQKENRRYSSNPEEKKKQILGLQYNFAKSIEARIHHSAVSTKEEKKVLNNICQEYFYEELNGEIDEEFLGSTLQVFARDGILSTNPARVTEKSQVYGINKLQRTLAKVTGTYHKLEALRERKIETRADQSAVSQELEYMLTHSQGGNESGKRL